MTYFEDKLRLQIRTEAQPAGELENAIINPSGDMQNYGWERILGDQFTWGEGSSGPLCENNETNTTITRFASNSTNVFQGYVITAQATFGTTVHKEFNGLNYTYYACAETRCGVQLLNGETIVSTTWASEGWQGSSRYERTLYFNVPDVTVPSGVTHARFVFDVRHTSEANHGGGGRHGVGLTTEMYVNDGQPLPPEVESTDWLDIFNPSANIEVVKAELDLGLLHADIYDVDLDPKTNPQMHKGALVRLQGLVGEGSWENIFVGHVTDIATHYTPTGRPHIALNAVDAVNRLANTSEDDGKATLEGIAELIQTFHSEIPYMWNGGVKGNTGISIPTVFSNPEANLLDLVTIARDTESGYAWVDKNGVLKMYTPDVMPDTGGKVAFADVFDPDAITRYNYVTNPLTEKNGVTDADGSGGTYWENALPPTHGVTVGLGVTVSATVDIDVYFREANTWFEAGNTSDPYTKIRVNAGETKRVFANSLWASRTATGLSKTAAIPQGVAYVRADGTTKQVGDVTFSQPMMEMRPDIDSTNYLTADEYGYFDGSSPVAAWEGTVNDSVSSLNMDRYVSYSDIQAGFATNDVINEVTIKKVAADATGKTVETVYGPFTDKISIRRYGAVQKEVTVTGDVNPQTLANTILDQFSTPRVTVEWLKFPVKNERSYEKVMLLDLYLDVDIMYKDVFNDWARVVGITHNISPDGWFTEVTFKPSDTVAQGGGKPTPLSPSQGPSTPFAHRYRTSNYTTTSNNTPIIFNGNVETSGITWSSNKFVIQKPGVYVVTFNTNTDNANEVTGYATAQINKNGSRVAATRYPGGAYLSAASTLTMRLQEGDELDFQIGTPGNLGVEFRGGIDETFVTVVWVGD